MNNFITNSKTANLSRRLSELVINSSELKFLVGFFYFSGLRELYIPLSKNTNVILKVLVGLNVDKLNNELVEYADAEDRSGRLSNEAIQNKFLDSLKKSINTEKFDHQDFYEQVKYFVELIEQNRLIIKKTLKPNHSKLYIFKLQPEQVGRQSLFITGSSNLTGWGLSAQEEFNVEISDYGVGEAEDYFDSLWEEAVPITENEKVRDKLLELINHDTLVRKITPFEAYALVLKTYLDSFDKKEIGLSLVNLFKKNGYIPYQYQLDAISQALGIIEKNNGVILADVVGLGKTIIACAISHELKKRGVIICPPGIMGDPRKKDAGWNMYKEQFRLYDWEVWSLGDLEKLQDQIKSGSLQDIEVVIIDEAHRFRNQDTQSYEYLKNICRGRIVILLTATPFNNRPADILSLLKLFIVPKKSSITLENNLVDKFTEFKTAFDRLAYIKKYHNSTDPKKCQKAYAYYQALFGEPFVLPLALERVKQRAKYLAKQIRDVIEPVTIRRNRLDLLGNPYYKNEATSLSRVADPIEWFFELSKAQSDFYDVVIKDYFADPDEGGRFKGAMYRPFEYEKERQPILEDRLPEKENFEFIQQRNLYDFMRRLLVKRFESSFGSFEQSLKNFKHITESVLEFINKTDRYILDRGLIEKIYDKDPEIIEEELRKYAENLSHDVYPRNHKIYKVSDFRYREEFLADLQSDLDLFDQILEELKELHLVENDPKAACLIKNIKNHFQQEPQKKVAIFSEYLDTVKYLEPKLEQEFPAQVLVIAGDLTSARIAEINSNFDASYPHPEDKYKILLSSDKISEGFNLNRAGMVINYDIPWNPVRVIQRVGRINRISKKVFDELYIVNFFPTETGAELVKAREIASNKMFLIHNTLGEDSKIFDIDEEPTPAGLYLKIQQNPESKEEASFYTRMVNEFEIIKQEHPELVRALDSFPVRVKVAKRQDQDELLVFIKKGRLFIYRARYDQKEDAGPVEVTFDEAYERIVCGVDEKALKLSEKFWRIYGQIKDLRERSPLPPGPRGLEQQAINSLKTLLNLPPDNQLSGYKEFLRTLLEDIINYGTLPDYTLRRIANLEAGDENKMGRTIKEIEDLKNELDDNYLEKEKQRQRRLEKEIIVAIENQKS